jgi:hypothetical protein
MPVRAKAGLPPNMLGETLGTLQDSVKVILVTYLLDTG